MSSDAGACKCGSLYLGRECVDCRGLLVPLIKLMEKSDSTEHLGDEPIRDGRIDMLCAVRFFLPIDMNPRDCKNIRRG